MTCIHIDHDGTTWVITPEGIPTQVIGKYRPSKLLSTVYRVIGIPQNYKLIISLYLALISKEIKGKLLVGAPSICHRYHNSSLQLLNCISVLNAHDNLPHTWHTVDSASYRNFLLLQVRQEQLYDSSPKLQDRVQHWYSQHVTYPFWQFLKIEQHSDLLIAQVQKQLIKSLAQPFALEQLAAQFHLTKRTLLRRFKTALNDTPLNYLQRLRVEQAKRLLETTNQPVEQIVLQVGYEDVSSFRKLFLQYTELTPSQYRQKFSQGDTFHCCPTDSAALS